MSGNLTIDELDAAIAAGEIDTVIVAFADAQGRLVGKRVSARVLPGRGAAAHGAEACNYLLSVDVDMNTVDGYAMSSWETRLRRHDAAPRLRHPPPHPVARRGSALVMADLAVGGRRSGRAVAARHPEAPARAARRAGLVAYSGTELEFIVFDDTYRDAWARGYRDLTPSTDYNVDYDLLASGALEPLLRDIRLSMDGAGMYCEGVKGECNFGQQEIAFRYAEVLETPTSTRSTRTARRRSPSNHGKALTFMAKFNEREGNSCHIHLSVRDGVGRSRSWPATASTASAR